MALTWHMYTIYLITYIQLCNVGRTYRKYNKHMEIFDHYKKHIPVYKRMSVQKQLLPDLIIQATGQVHMSYYLNLF